MQVGFAGLGRMGTNMARNLFNAGHGLTVWNRSPAASRRFAEETGCRIANTPENLTSETEVIVTMLADDAASNAVYLGENGLLTATGGARVFVEMGTVSPDHISRLQANAGNRRIIDAPVSGATQAAHDATLMIMAGATEEDIRHLTPCSMQWVAKPLHSAGRARAR